jgi:hypothetical protein
MLSSKELLGLMSDIPIPVPRIPIEKPLDALPDAAEYFIPDDEKEQP